MRPLASIDAIAFAELLSRCRDAGGHPAYPPNGAFVDLERDGRHYWYYKGYERATDGATARQTLKYVGLVGDPISMRQPGGTTESARPSSRGVIWQRVSAGRVCLRRNRSKAP